MPIGSLAIYLAMAGLAFAEGPSRGQGWWRRIAVLILGGVVVSLVIESGFNTHTLFHSPPVLDGIAGATAVVIAVDVIGLPQPVARRLHPVSTAGVGVRPSSLCPGAEDRRSHVRSADLLERHRTPPGWAVARIARTRHAFSAKDHRDRVRPDDSGPLLLVDFSHGLGGGELPPVRPDRVA